ncbi:MAG: hypothetical protein V4636_13160 [Pseudomonadota bacterium]
MPNEEEIIGGSVPALEPLPEPIPFPVPEVVPDDDATKRRKRIESGANRMFGRHRQMLSEAMAYAQQQDPDAYAKDVRAADKLGVRPDLVAGSPEMHAAATNDHARTDRIAQHHPDLATWLQDPTNAALVHDQLGPMRTLDVAMRALADPTVDPSGYLPAGFKFTETGTIIEPLPGGYATVIGGFDDLDKVLERRLESESIREEDARRLYERVGASPFLAGMAQSLASSQRALGMQTDLMRQVDEFSQGSELVHPGFGNDLIRLAGGITGDIPLLVAGGGVRTIGKTAIDVWKAGGNLGRVAAPIRAARQALAGSDKLRTYLRGALERSATGLPLAARTGIVTGEEHGFINGALAFTIEAVIPGLVPGGVESAVASGLKGRAVSGQAWAGVIGSGLRHGGMEAGEESATELAHALHEAASGIDPRALQSDRLMHRLALAAVAGFGAGTAFNAPGDVLAKLAQDGVAADEALAFRGRIGALADAVAGNPLAERSPERLRQMVGERTFNQSVYFETKDWDAHFAKEGVDPVAAADRMGLRDAYLTAKAHGGTMAVPLQTLVVPDAPTTPGAKPANVKGLLDLARQVPGAPNAEQAPKIDEEAQAQVAALVRGNTPAPVEEAQPDIAEIIGAQLAANLEASGFDAGDAAKYGQGFGLMMSTLAKRMGVDPQALAQRFPVQARAATAEEEAAPTEAGTFDQPAFHGSPHEFDKFTTEAIGTGDGNRDYGWGLYFTSDHHVAKQYQRITDAKGRTYAVDVPEDSDLISWESTVDKQPPKVREALNAAIAMMEADRGEFGDESQLERFASIEAGADTSKWKAFQVYRTLAGYLGSKDRAAFGVKGDDRGASLWLASHGVKGAKFKSEAAKGAVNFVIYDADAVRIVSYDQRTPATEAIRLTDAGGLRARAEAHARGELDEQAEPDEETRIGPAVRREESPSYAQGKRADITFGKDGKSLIRLFQSRDRSSVLHELGHFWLETLGDLAADPTAPPQIRDDYAAALKFLGVDKRSDIGVDQHELFARGFEKFLATGKAPSIASRRLFSRFRAWLLDVYKGVLGLSRTLNVELSPEIVGVFNRMIATDEEIAAAEQEAGASPLFATAEQAGKTPEEFAAYRQTTEDAHSRSVSELESQLVEGYQREQADFYQEERAKVRAEIEQEIAAAPVYQAIAALQDGLPDGSTPKLDKDGVVEVLGGKPEDLALLPGPAKGGAERPNRGRTVYTTDGGIHPDQAAGIFGFGSGAELVQALIQAPDLATLVDARTDDVMKTRYPDPLTDGQLQERAQDAVESDYRERVVQDELRALRALERAARPVVDQAVGEARENDQAVAAARAEAAERDRALVGSVDRLLSTLSGAIDDAAVKQASADALANAKAVADARVSAIENDRSLEDAASRLAAVLSRDIGKAERKQAITEAVANVKAAAKVRKQRADEDKDLTRKVDQLVDAMGRDLAKQAVLPLVVYNEAAREIIAKTQVLNLKPAQYLTAARANAREAARLVAKQKPTAEDYAEAATAKQQELLSMALYRASRDVLKRAATWRTFLSSFTEAKKRAEIGKAGGWEWVVTSPYGMPEVFADSEQEARQKAAEIGGAFERSSGYLEQIDALLERFDLRKSMRSAKSLRGRESLLDWILRLETNPDGSSSGQFADIPQRIRNEAFAKNWRLLTVGELRDLHDAVANIAHLAQTKKRLLRDQGKRDLDDMVTGAASSIIEHQPSAAQVDAQKGALESVTSAFGGYIASHRKIASLARTMDGYQDGGPMWDLFIRPLNDAANAEVEMAAASTKALDALFRTWGKKDGARATVPELGGALLSPMGKVMVALNWGNAGNRQRLLSEFSGAQVEAMLTTLDSADLALVQGIWDHVGSYWSEIQAKMQRMSGVAAERVEAVPFTVQSSDGKTVQMRGGYLPIVYDSRRSPNHESLTAAGMAELAMRGAAMQATTRRGHEQARLKIVLGKKLLFDPRVITDHVNQVIHDLTHHEVLVDSSRLLSDKRMAKVMHDHYGPNAARQFRKALEDVAIGDSGASNTTEKAWQYMRGGVAISAMAFNPTSALVQITGLSQAMLRVGPKWMGKAIGRMFRDATSLESSGTFVDGKSTFMRMRAQTQLRELREAIQRSTASVARRRLTQFGFYMMTRMQRAVDIPTWLGAYEQALNADPDDARAVAIADQTVIDTQGSGFTKDLSAVQRSGVLSILSPLYHYLNVQFNLTAESAGRFARADKSDPMAWMRLAGDFLLLYSFPAVLTLLLRDMARGAPEDEESTFASRVAKEHLTTLLGTTLLTREIAGAFSSSRDYSGPAGTRGIGAAVGFLHQLMQGDVDRGLVRAGVEVAGLGLRLPSVEAQRIIDAFMSESEDNQVRAAVFGKRPSK